MDEPMTIDFLLEHSCPKEVLDREAYDKWDKEIYDPWRKLEDDTPFPFYTGEKKFLIELCCESFEIIAKQVDQGKYEIISYQPVVY